MIAEIFAGYGPNHMIFAAGYPSMGKEEFDAVYQVASEVDNCSLATHGRMLKEDIDLGFQAARPAAFGRVSFAVPISENYSQIMVHQPAAKTMRQAIEMARYAMDQANGIPVDVAFGGASGSEPAFLADSAHALFAEGIATVKLCDSVGRLYPLESRHLFANTLQFHPEETYRFGAHLHNDLGFSLTSNIDAVQQGVRLIATSWFGIAERTGLTPTEQLLFVLALPGDQLAERTGIQGNLWHTSPDLSRLPAISQMLSEMLNFPLRTTDPVISPAINEIATGAYFNDPGAFKPYDPQDLLKVPPKIVLTHLANQKIIRLVADRLGYQLSPDEQKEAMSWVKAYAFSKGTSEIPEAVFSQYLAERLNGANKR